MRFSRFISITLIAILAIHSHAIFAYSAMGNQLMAERATKALASVRKMDVPHKRNTTILIMEEKFDTFEKLSKKYEKEFQNDPLYESPLYKLYYALIPKNVQLIEKLDKWVKMRPSYISYGVRGVYKVNRGYHIRGGKFIKDTPPENIVEMDRWHKEAKHDLLIAIELNNRLSPAYSALIDIEKASGNIVMSKKILDDALRVIPETYYIRRHYICSLFPEWGGSYKLMQKYVDSLDEKALINPRIWSLKGEIAAEHARKAYCFEKNYKKAIDYYTEALSFGDRMFFLKQRGFSYMEINENELALKDFVKYIEYDRSDTQIMYKIRHLKNKLKKSDDSI